jgi:hypothetical protein
MSRDFDYRAQAEQALREAAAAKTAAERAEHVRRAVQWVYLATAGEPKGAPKRHG